MAGYASTDFPHGYFLSVTSYNKALAGSCIATDFTWSMSHSENSVNLRLEISHPLSQAAHLLAFYLLVHLLTALATWILQLIHFGKLENLHKKKEVWVERLDFSNC